MKTISRYLMLQLLLLPRAVFGAETVSSEPINYRVIDAKAVRCCAAISQELALFGRQHPEFKDIEKQVSIKPTPKGHQLYCLFSFKHHTRFHRLPLGCAWAGYDEPEDNGVILEVGVQGRGFGKTQTTEIFEMNLGGDKIWAYYYLVLGKNFTESEGLVKSIIKKHLNEFCDAVKKMK